MNCDNKPYLAATKILASRSPKPHTLARRMKWFVHIQMPKRINSTFTGHIHTNTWKPPGFSHAAETWSAIANAVWIVLIEAILHMCLDKRQLVLMPHTYGCISVPQIKC